MRDETEGDGLPEEAGPLPPSLLPYEQWIEQAYQEVMIKALQFAQKDGLPGAHHFYITFRTTARGVQIPTRLLAQYPQEMTIVLQHQYWDLKVDRAAGLMSVGLSFGSVPSTLVIPFSAISGFADPQVRLVLRFTVQETVVVAEPERLAPAPAPVSSSTALGAPSKLPAPKSSAAQPFPGQPFPGQPSPAQPSPAQPPNKSPAPQSGEDAPQVVSLDAFRRRGPATD